MKKKSKKYLACEAIVRYGARVNQKPVVRNAILLCVASVGIAIILAEQKFGHKLADVSPSRVAAVFAPGKYLGRGPYHYQKRPSDCALASLANVLLISGEKIVEMDGLASEFGDVSRGVSISELKMVAERVGLSGELLTLASDTGPAGLVPSILFVKGNHFVVLKDCTDDSCTIIDPALGVFELNHRELSEIWNGVLLYFDDYVSIRH